MSKRNGTTYAQRGNQPIAPKVSDDVSMVISSVVYIAQWIYTYSPKPLYCYRFRRRYCPSAGKQAPQRASCRCGHRWQIKRPRDGHGGWKSSRSDRKLWRSAASALRSCRKGFHHGNGPQSGQHQQVDELTQVGGRDEMTAAIASSKTRPLRLSAPARASIRKTSRI